MKTDETLVERPSPLATPGRIAAGSPAFRKVNVAVFFCGFSIFAILYSAQPLMPLFVNEFGVTPAESSLALSLPSITMAVAMLVASSASEALGRKPMMVAALIGSSLLTLALSFAQGWGQVVWLRALTGVALSGAPAVTLAYLGEEMAPSAVAPAVGLYIGGSAFGGMVGRLVAATLADYGSWRWAMAGIAATGLVSALVFWRALPPSRAFTARELAPAALTRSLGRCLVNGRVGLLVMEGFAMFGAFVTIYNYLGFRLQAPPFDYSPAQAGLIFVVYPAGVFASAYMGKRAARRGRGPTLILALAIMVAGLALTLPDWTPTIALGLALVTFGFFGAHAICSSWAPAMVERDKAQASSLYLLFYYIGGGSAGTLGGFFWASYGWRGVAAFSGALSLAALALAAALARFAPPRA